MVADFLVVSMPMRSIEVVDSDRWELVEVVLPPTLRTILRTESARCQCDKLVQIVNEEFFFKVCKSIKHLHSAL